MYRIGMSADFTIRFLAVYFEHSGFRLTQVERPKSVLEPFELLFGGVHPTKSRIFAGEAS